MCEGVLRTLTVVGRVIRVGCLVGEWCVKSAVVKHGTRATVCLSVCLSGRPSIIQLLHARF